MTHLYAARCPDCDDHTLVSDVFDRTGVCIACGVLAVETCDGTEYWQLGSLGELASGDRPVIGGAA